MASCWFNVVCHLYLFKQAVYATVTTTHCFSYKIHYNNGNETWDNIHHLTLQYLESLWRDWRLQSLSIHAKPEEWKEYGEGGCWKAIPSIWDVEGAYLLDSSVYVIQTQTVLCGSLCWRMGSAPFLPPKNKWKRKLMICSSLLFLTRWRNTKVQ